MAKMRCKVIKWLKTDHNRFKTLCQNALDQERDKQSTDGAPEKLPDLNAPKRIHLKHLFPLAARIAKGFTDPLPPKLPLLPEQLELPSVPPSAVKIANGQQFVFCPNQTTVSLPRPPECDIKAKSKGFCVPATFLNLVLMLSEFNLHDAIRELGAGAKLEFQLVTALVVSTKSFNSAVWFAFRKLLAQLAGANFMDRAAQLPPGSEVPTSFAMSFKHLYKRLELKTSAWVLKCDECGSKRSGFCCVVDYQALQVAHSRTEHVFSRTQCNKCQQLAAKQKIRVGDKIILASYEGKMSMVWYHEQLILKIGDGSYRAFAVLAGDQRVSSGHAFLLLVTPARVMRLIDCNRPQGFSPQLPNNECHASLIVFVRDDNNKVEEKMRALAGPPPYIAPSKFQSSNWVEPPQQVEMPTQVIDSEDNADETLALEALKQVLQAAGVSPPKVTDAHCESK